MGLFSRNYDIPGPGIRKDEPRKKGAARFFELLTREFGDLVKLNLLFVVCLIPSIAVFILSLGFNGIYWAIVFIISILLAYPVGGIVTACVYYITKMMRDDPSYVWYEFKRKFKENHKQAAPFGMLCTAFVYTQILLWDSVTKASMLLLEADPDNAFQGVVATGDSGVDAFMVIIGLMSLLIFGMIVPYIYMHYAYIDLNIMGIAKNSVLISFGHLPRSFMGALTGGVIWIAFALFFPLSMLAIPFILIFGITTSMLLCFMWVWKPFDTTFKIEETLIKRTEENEGFDDKIEEIDDL